MTRAHKAPTGLAASRPSSLSGDKREEVSHGASSRKSEQERGAGRTGLEADEVLDQVLHELVLRDHVALEVHHLADDGLVVLAQVGHVLLHGDLSPCELVDLRLEARVGRSAGSAGVVVKVRAWPARTAERRVDRGAIATLTAPASAPSVRSSRLCLLCCGRFPLRTGGVSFELQREAAKKGAHLDVLEVVLHVGAKVGMAELPGLQASGGGASEREDGRVSSAHMFSLSLARSLEGRERTLSPYGLGPSSLFLTL